MKRKAKTLAKLPRLKSDAEAVRFVADGDLTQFALSGLKPTRFEFAPKEARINMRLPGELLSAVKRAAKQRGVPYQRFIRQTLEEALKGSGRGKEPWHRQCRGRGASPSLTARESMGCRSMSKRCAAMTRDACVTGRCSSARHLTEPRASRAIQVSAPYWAALTSVLAKSFPLKRRGSRAAFESA
jgi:predicted DNA binding CopG/RHH family protein